MAEKPTVQRDKHEGKLSRPARARPARPGKASGGHRGARQKVTPRPAPLRQRAKPRSLHRGPALVLPLAVVGRR